MALAKAQQLDDIVDYLRQKRHGDVSLSEVVALAELTAQSLQSFFATMDAAVCQELLAIADYIAAMKREIGALQVNELKERHIPAAGHELEAIVQATEKATHTIMESAETVMAADARDGAAYKALVDRHMLIVFEACSFQDITGQRISKVVETLQHIEHRVSRFAVAMGVADQSGACSEHERERAERRERLLLHGPDPGGRGIAQAEVDLLLDKPASATAAQVDIDRMFD
jgi:chemotaxis protein CheZ